jgi:hypothetical protein
MQTIDAAQQNLTNLKTHFNTANTSASLVGSEFTANTNLTNYYPSNVAQSVSSHALFLCHGL